MTPIPADKRASLNRLIAAERVAGADITRQDDRRASSSALVWCQLLQDLPAVATHHNPLAPAKTTALARLINRSTDVDSLLPRNWPITAVDTTDRQFRVAGRVLDHAVTGTVLTVLGSPGNDGDWTVDALPTYDAGTAETVIPVVEPIPSTLAGGAFILAQWPIVGVTVADRELQFSGQLDWLAEGAVVELTGANAGTYTLADRSPVYDDTTDQTTITVEEPLPSATVDGRLTVIDHRWQITGLNANVLTLDTPHETQRQPLARVLAGSTVTIVDSTGNDQTWTAAAPAVIDDATGTTTLEIDETLPDTTADGWLLLHAGPAFTPGNTLLAVTNRQRAVGAIAGDVVGVDTLAGEYVLATGPRQYLQGYVTETGSGGPFRGRYAADTATLDIWDLDSQGEWQPTGLQADLQMRYSHSVITRGQWVVATWDRGEWRPLTGGDRDFGVVRIKNCWAFALPRNAPVGLDWMTDESLPTADGSHRFDDGAITFEATAPSTRHAKQTAITLSPLDPGETGWAVISGIVPARVDNQDLDYRPQDARHGLAAQQGYAYPVNAAEHWVDGPERDFLTFTRHHTVFDEDTEFPVPVPDRNNRGIDVYGDPDPIQILQHWPRTPQCTSCEATVECVGDRWQIVSTQRPGGGDCDDACAEPSRLVPEYYLGDETALPCTDGDSQVLEVPSDVHSLALLHISPTPGSRHQAFGQITPGWLVVPEVAADNTQHCAHHRCRYRCVELTPGNFSWQLVTSSPWQQYVGIWGAPESDCTCAQAPPDHFVCGADGEPRSITISPQPLSYAVTGPTGCSGSLTLTCGGNVSMHLGSGSGQSPLGHGTGHVDEFGVGTWSGWRIKQTSDNTCSGTHCGCNDGGTERHGPAPSSIAPAACDYCRGGDSYTSPCADQRTDACISQPTVTCPGYCYWIVAEGRHGNGTGRPVANPPFDGHVNRWTVSRVACQGGNDAVDPAGASDGAPVTMLHDGPCGCGDWPSGAWFQSGEHPQTGAHIFSAGTTDPVGTTLIYDCNGTACI